ncbi:hypothetical protein CH252_28415, partial [Rhodococcus sp. 06-1477-1B]
MTDTCVPAPSGLSRRTVIAGAAWAVPAVAVATSAPAFAASSSSALALTTPNMQTVAAGTTPVTATITDPSGQSLAGRAVSFTGPTGTSFSPTTATT